MKTLSSVISVVPLVRKCRWISETNDASVWQVPRAVYATGNPCLAASHLKVFRMRRRDEKCCVGKTDGEGNFRSGKAKNSGCCKPSLPESSNASSSGCCGSNASSCGAESKPSQKIQSLLNSSIQANEAKPQFYRRELPASCISFGSAEGKRLFGEALAAGFMNSYFPLAAQFRTQEEPAFCGLTTLVMVLNALAVDPGRIWKGPWRWFHENMLDCCIPLSEIETQGITLDQFNCLASCNALNVQTIRPDLSSPTLRKQDRDKFRDLVAKMCQREDAFLVVSYSRRLLSQTGDGHFSPIGGFHAAKDLVLILDTARFKYPPHWVPLTALWEAMLAIDPSTGLNRGFSLVQRLDSLFKADSQLIFKPSVYFSVNAPESHRLVVRMFILAFDSWAFDSSSPVGPQVVEEALEVLVDLIAAAGTEFHLLTTRQDGMSCLDAKAPVSIPIKNKCLVTDLISAIQTLPLYSTVDVTLERISDIESNGGSDGDDGNDVGVNLNIDKNNNECQKVNAICGGSDKNGENAKASAKKSDDRNGDAKASVNNDVDIGQNCESRKGDSTSVASHPLELRPRFGLTHAARNVVCESEDCGASGSNVAEVGAAEFATMFLLAWPFESDDGGEATTNNLRTYVEGALEMPLPPILRQEVVMLRHQLRQIKNMFQGCDC